MLKDCGSSWSSPLNFVVCFFCLCLDKADLHTQFLQRKMDDVKDTKDRSAKLCVIFSGRGVAESSALAVANALRGHVKTKLVTSFDTGLHRDKHVVVIPGGDERRMVASVGASGVRQLRRFVKAGGRYVGICAGAAIATTRKRYALSLVRLWCVDDNRDRDAKMVTLIDPENGRDGAQWDYLNGPWMVPMKRDPPSLTDVWRFQTHPAHIAVCTCDQIHLFSVHPEFSPANHQWLVRAVTKV